MVEMAKPGPKPKPPEETRTAITSLRSLDASKEQWQAAAVKAGLSLNEWAIRKLDSAATRELKKK